MTTGPVPSGSGLPVPPPTAVAERLGQLGSMVRAAEARTFRFVWSYSGVSLKLAGFGQVTTSDEAGKAAAGKGTA